MRWNEITTVSRVCKKDTLVTHRPYSPYRPVLTDTLETKSFSRSLFVLRNHKIMKYTGYSDRSRQARPLPVPTLQDQKYTGLQILLSRIPKTPAWHLQPLSQCQSPENYVLRAQFPVSTVSRILPEQPHPSQASSIIPDHPKRRERPHILAAHAFFPSPHSGTPRGAHTNYQSTTLSPAPEY
jgi:hypothetical protein